MLKTAVGLKMFIVVAFSGRGSYYARKGLRLPNENNDIKINK